MPLKLIFFGIILLFSPVHVFGQIHIEVVKVPILTPADDKIYISGSFNNWNSGDVNYELKKTKEGVYIIDLPDTLHHFEYKFTRGNWDLVEGNFNGMRPNRVFNINDDKKIIKVTIESWEDFFHYTLVVKKIPESTPHDASIYIAGNFNDWNPEYADYKLTKMKDGTYRISIYSNLEKIEYKFTRGSWNAVEGRENGRAIPNRVLYRDKQLNHIIEAEVATWEDLSYHISIYDMLLLFSAFQGILLIVAIFTIHDYNKDANRLLMLLIGVTSLGLISRVLPNYRGIFEIFPKLILLPELILFLYAPLFYFYIQKLLTIPNKFSQIWYHFLPFVILFLFYLPFFMMNDEQLIDKIVDRQLSGIFSAVGGVALLTNSYYWFVCRQIVTTYKNQYSKSYSYEQNLQYLNTAIFIKGLCLCVWIFTCLSVIAGKVLEIDTITLVEKSTDSIWLVFSTMPYFMGYFAIHQPEIFRLPQRITFFNPVERDNENTLEQPIATKSEEKMVIEEQHISEHHDLHLQPLKEKLEAFMIAHKPYINPRLTLIELADHLQIHPNLLSKVINECFEKNFFDFVNTYRINEFKHLVETPKFENYTLLSIAFEVGFNSKTAFNRSFKKLTNYTPSEYFYKVKGRQLTT